MSIEIVECKPYACACTFRDKKGDSYLFSSVFWALSKDEALGILCNKLQKQEMVRMLTYLITEIPKNFFDPDGNDGSDKSNPVPTPMIQNKK